jgi:hypothetical protein
MGPAAVAAGAGTAIATGTALRYVGKPAADVAADRMSTPAPAADSPVHVIKAEMDAIYRRCTDAGDLTAAAVERSEQATERILATTDGDPPHALLEEALTILASVRNDLESVTARAAQAIATPQRWAQAL